MTVASTVKLSWWHNWRSNTGLVETCKNCNGEKLIYIRDKFVQCPVCKGKGWQYVFNRGTITEWRL